MGYAKSKFTDPLSFVNALRKSTKAVFENDVLKAEAFRIQERNSKRETMIKYSLKENGREIPFSTFCSCHTPHAIHDFVYECLSFKIKLPICLKRDYILSMQQK